MILLIAFTVAVLLVALGGATKLQSALHRRRFEVQQAWRGVEAALLRRHEAIAELADASRGLACSKDLAALTAAWASASRPGGLPGVRSIVERLVDRALGPVLEALPKTAGIAGPLDRLARANRQLAIAQKQYNAAAGRVNEMTGRLPVRLLANANQPLRFEYFEFARPPFVQQTAVIYECGSLSAGVDRGRQLA